MERELGVGGMGRTLLAKHLGLAQKVVVKELKPGLTTNAGLVRRFRREARILGNLSHPNVIRLIAADLQTRDPWFVMEYCPGGSLEQRLRAPDWMATLQYCAEAIAGIAYAHARPEKVVHRDIKPSNILLGADGLAKVADFGLAYMRTRDSTTLTPSGEGLGTPSFMAPEQRTGAKRVSEAADVFSMALTIRYLLTGGTSSDYRLAARQVKPARIPAVVLEGLSSLLAAATREDAASRITAAELLARLRELLAMGGRVS